MMLPELCWWCSWTEAPLGSVITWIFMRPTMRSPLSNRQTDLWGRHEPSACDWRWPWSASGRGGTGWWEPVGACNYVRTSHFDIPRGFPRCPLDALPSLGPHGGQRLKKKKHSILFFHQVIWKTLLTFSSVSVGHVAVVWFVRGNLDRWTGIIPGHGSIMEEILDISSKFDPRGHAFPHSLQAGWSVFCVQLTSAASRKHQRIT